MTGMNVLSERLDEWLDIPELPKISARPAFSSRSSSLSVESLPRSPRARTEIANYKNRLTITYQIDLKDHIITPIFRH